MANVNFVVDLNLNNQQLMNAALHKSATAPQGAVAGQIYFNTGSNKPMVFTGSEWLDLASQYSHPTIAGNGQPATALTAAKVISRITLDNGHVTGVETRDLTAANIGAATTSHTHAFGELTGVPANTILANNTGTAGSPKAVTVADMLTMLAIGYGDAALLTTGTDTGQKTWSAKQIADYVTTKVGNFITKIDLSVANRTATQLDIKPSGTGTSATIPGATGALAGLMTGADKTKLDGLNNYTAPTYTVSNEFATELTAGLQVLSQITVNNNGHTTSIKGRNLTAADIAGVMIADGATSGTNQTYSIDKINSLVGNSITGALVYQGAWNNNKTTDASVKTGYTYVVAANGTFLGEQIEPGDMIIALTDNPGGNAAKWQAVNKNIPAIVAASETVEGIVRYATNAEAAAGTLTNRAVTPAGLKHAITNISRGFKQTFGNTTDMVYNLNHGLASADLIITVRDNTTKEVVYMDVKCDATKITLTLNNAPGTNKYEVLATKI